jgi:uncharacterized membrane protein YhaH (DUF805 family)/DNA-directed RNA polymerase subunit RPC12/RpoP
MSFMAKCNKCNATCTAEDEWIGQEAECPECGATIIIEKPVEKPANKPSLSIRKAQPETKDMQKSATSLPSDGQITCPNCQHPSNPEAVICLECGTNLKTGKKLSSGGSSSKSNFKIWYLEVLKKYAVFKGRARRKEYWYFVLCNIIISMVLGYIDGKIGIFNMKAGVGVLSTIYSLAVFIPGLAVSIRRLHDIGKSGWWFFLIFIPCVGPLILLFFMIKDSEDGENQYGTNPKLED